jgi:hypothetical protein
MGISSAGYFFHKLPIEPLKTKQIQANDKLKMKNEK